MKYLIVNADDFGLNKYINAGIIKGFREGIITSTSLMCSAPAFEEAVDYAKANPKLGIGIHLTLVGGVKPLLSVSVVPSIVDENGFFYDNYLVFLKKFMQGKIVKHEIKAELSAQIERALATGLTITHIDSHQHIHVFPGIAEIVSELAVKYGVQRVRVPAESIFFGGGILADPVRWVGKAGLTFCAYLARKKFKKAGLEYPQAFFGMMYGGSLTETHINEIISVLPDGIAEIMTHPGLDNKKLGQYFPWKYHWEEELKGLVSPTTRNNLHKNNVTLINFGGMDYAK